MLFERGTMCMYCVKRGGSGEWVTLVTGCCDNIWYYDDVCVIDVWHPISLPRVPCSITQLLCAIEVLSWGSTPTSSLSPFLSLSLSLSRGHTTYSKLTCLHALNIFPSFSSPREVCLRVLPWCWATVSRKCKAWEEQEDKIVNTCCTLHSLPSYSYWPCTYLWTRLCLDSYMYMYSCTASQYHASNVHNVLCSYLSLYHHLYLNVIWNVYLYSSLSFLVKFVKLASSVKIIQ